VVFLLSLTAGAAYLAKNLHRSTVVAAFNRNDATSIALQSLSSMGIDRSDSSFETRFSDPFFLQELAQKAGIQTQGRLGKLLIELGLQTPQSESDRNAQLVAFFAKRIIPIVNGSTGHLTLEVLLDGTPEKSQELAALAMEEFINSELSVLAASLGLKIDTLSSALKRSQQRLADIQAKLKASASEKNQDGGISSSNALSSLGDATSMGDRQREADLMDRIRASEGEFSALVNDHARRRILLESEFQRLSSRLAPNHPDLIAKQGELKGMNESSQILEDSARNLSRLRREMLLLKTESSLPGFGSSADDPYGSLEARIEANQVATMQQTITELDVERESLIRQASDPALRTRLKVIRPATYDVRPASRKKLQVAVGGALVALIAGLSLILWREARSPLVRDAWRVTRFTGLPVLAQLSTESFKSFPRISADQADLMRSKLSSKSFLDRPAVRTLLAYRKVELALFRSCRGKVVYILSAGRDDLTADFIFNLANIVATDTGRAVLVVDGNTQEPIVPAYDSELPDLIDGLLGQAAPASIVAKASGNRAFDVISVTRPLTGVRTRAIQGPAVERFFGLLEPLYDLILVRALPETHFIENFNLMGAASDHVFGIDAEHTTFFDLGRSLDQVGRSKLRGIFLVGS
jgi:hypothetical protein